MSQEICPTCKQYQFEGCCKKRIHDLERDLIDMTAIVNKRIKKKFNKKAPK